MKSKAVLATAVACVVASMSSARADDFSYEWYTVANNGDVIPTDSSSYCGSCHEDMASSGSLVSTSTKVFNSYNQPAVSKQGVVVFRARSRGGEGMGPGQGEPERGIYMRNLAEQGPLYMVYRRGGMVPQPNNLLASFNEFPSVPRIDSGSDTIATRGQTRPVWTYLPPDEVEATRTGTAGIYTNLHGTGATGASMLGDVNESGVQTFPHFQVPVEAGVPVGTGFDQFPGSPAVTERNTIVFKGNFAVDGVGRTGVFYRDLVADGGVASIQFIAASGKTTIPGCKPKDDPVCKFGSTAPPSAGGKYAVFAGYDNEQSPTKGGIYRVLMGVMPIVYETVVKIGQQVPGEPKGTRFEVFGEAMSVSSTGRTILFWGGWGGTHPVKMVCPNEGGAVKKAACEAATLKDPENDVPNEQGFFVRDMQLGTTTAIVKTGDYVDGVRVEDFVYWNFSGRIEGMGEGGDDIEEAARWRSATFGAVSGNGVPNISAFKAKTVDGEDGIYLRKVLPSGLSDLFKLLKTGDIQDEDVNVDVSPEADGMEISAVGIERDGFRGNWLALTASMIAPAAVAATEGEDSGEVTGWAGVYVARFLDEDALALY